MVFSPAEGERGIRDEPRLPVS